MKRERKCSTPVFLLYLQYEKKEEQEENSSCMVVCVKQFTSLNVEFIQNNKTIEKVEV